MITVIVFSKDRAAQTELMIRSMKEKFHVDKDIKVLFNSSSEDFQKGFVKCSEIHNDVDFLYEDSFKKYFEILLDQVETEHIVFFTDDDVFVKDVYNVEFDSEKYHCHSLRMNPTINRCYPANNKPIEPPELHMSVDKMVWDWTEAKDQHCCWGYPMAINGHIYKASKIIHTILPGKFNNVNSLESWINRNRWHDISLMISFSETKVFNVQNNFVQGPRMNEQKYSVECLNEQFLSGKRISTENIYGLEPQNRTIRIILNL
jgi:hypothetical protein